MWGLDVLITGGVAGAIVTAAGSFLHVLLNKKVTTPADSAAQRRAEIVERNEMLSELRTHMTSLKTELAETETRLDRIEAENDLLKQEALENQHYIYRCIGTIYRLGSAADIPKPVPLRIKLTNYGDTQ